MNLESALKPIRIFSNVLGLNFENFFGRTYTFLVFVATNLLVYASFMHLSRGNNEIEFSGLDSMILWTQFFANIIHASVLLFASIIKSRLFFTPINEINEIDLSLRLFGVKINERFLYRKVLSQILASLIISNLLGARDIYSTISNKSFETFFHWLHYSYVNCLSITIDCLFVDYLEVLKKRFFEINQLLKSMKNQHKLTGIIYVTEIDSDIKNKTNKASKNFEKLRLIHRDVCSISKKVNQSFGLQHLISTAISLVMITGHLYEAYHFLIIDKNFIEMGLLKMIWIIFHSARLFYVSNACKETSNEASFAAFIIHEIPLQKVSNDVSSQIKHFSLQLIHDKVKFNACGFFNIDFNLICSIVGVVTTYLVILIQMDRNSYTHEHHAG